MKIIIFMIFVLCDSNFTTGDICIFVVFILRYIYLFLLCIAVASKCTKPFNYYYY